MQPLDQYILARTAELDAAIRKAYDEFEFHRAYQALNEFTNSDLSALYLDVVKDRLYTFAPKSRGAAQRADCDVADRGGDDAVDCADSFVHGGRGLGASAEGGRTSGERASGAVPGDRWRLCRGRWRGLEADWEKLFEAARRQ